MKGRLEIVLAGVGGQGLVTIAGILGEAAVCEGRNACMSSSYGTEARGTFTKSDVILSDGDIDFIEATDPDAVLCLAQVAWDRYAPSLGEEALLIYDSETVTPSGECRAQTIGIPLSSLGGNLAALGALVALSGAVRTESAIEVIRRRGTLRKGSEEAFERGAQAV